MDTSSLMIALQVSSSAIVKNYKSTLFILCVILTPVNSSYNNLVLLVTRTSTIKKSNENFFLLRFITFVVIFVDVIPIIVQATYFSIV